MDAKKQQAEIKKQREQKERERKQRRKISIQKCELRLNEHFSYLFLRQTSVSDLCSVSKQMLCDQITPAEHFSCCLLRPLSQDTLFETGYNLKSFWSFKLYAIFIPVG